MFGVGFGELLLIAIIALVLLGPERLPEFIKAVGKVYAEFRHASAELKKAVMEVEEKTKEPPENTKEDTNEKTKTEGIL